MKTAKSVLSMPPAHNRLSALHRPQSAIRNPQFSFIVCLLSAILAALHAPALEFSVAPDQPLPQVYVDDPLIIELRSDVDGEASGTIVITPEHSLAGAKPEPASFTLGPVQLRAQSAYWQAIEGVSTERGRYRVAAHITVSGGGAAAPSVCEQTAAFCRVDRPLADATLPVCMRLDEGHPRALLAARGVSIRSVRLDVHEPDFAPKIEVVANMFQTVLALDAGNADTSESLAKSFADRVARWDVDPGNAPEVFTTIAKALRRGGVKAPIALVVNDARNVGTLFEAGIGQFVSAIVFRGAWPSANDLMAFRFAVERTGYEGIPILGAISGGQPQDTGIGVRIARQILTNLAKGVTPTEVDSALIYGEDLGDSYVYLGGLAQRLTGCAPVGEMDLVEGVQAFVFRAGPRWIIAFWTTHAPREVSVKVENASDLALFDARDNPLPAPSLKNGTVSVHVAAEPQFLIGKAGSVIYQAARTTARRHAAVFAGSEDFRTHLPPELLEVVRKFAAAESPGYTRMDFLDLLRIFPRIEELWHTGAVPRSVAVPALAALSRLARTLCVVEQERGEPFLEPLQKTLANCGQFQSLYLTSSAGASEVRERPDWILDEVGRLMTQAEQLGTEGRPIEACGMAALAEWRARALELAAKAQPLSLPEKAVAPAVVPAPQKPEKATTKKASSKTATPKAADQETATPRKEKEPAKTKSKKTTKDKK